VGALLAAGVSGLLAFDGLSLRRGGGQVVSYDAYETLAWLQTSGIALIAVGLVLTLRRTRRPSDN